MLGTDLGLRGHKGSKQTWATVSQIGLSLCDPGRAWVALRTQDSQCRERQRPTGTQASLEVTSQGREEWGQPTTPGGPPARPGSGGGSPEAHRGGLHVLQGSPLSYLGKYPASGWLKGGLNGVHCGGARQFVTLLK